MDMHNRTLHERCKSFVIAALQVLNSSLERGERIPATFVEDISGSRRLEPFFPSFINKHNKDLQQLPELITCIQLINEDDTIKKHFNNWVGTESGGQARFSEKEYLYRFLTQYLRTIESNGFFEYDVETFERAYKDFEDFFYRDKLYLEAFSPLENFRCNVEEVDLGQGLKIRRISEDEMNNIFRVARRASLMNAHRVPRLRYALTVSYKEKKIISATSGIQRFPNSIKELFGKVITALRLKKAGMVGSNLIRISPLTWQPTSSITTTGPIHYKHFIGQVYTLSMKEIEEFVDFWKSFRDFDINKNENRFLDTAIRQFNLSYPRDRTEDKSIDFMIAFESLFFKKGEKGEFSYRLSIRTAAFLGKSREERRKIFLRMRKAYYLRSRIVHGGEYADSIKLEEKTLPIGDFIFKIEELLRNSINLFLEQRKNGKEYKEIIKSIDLNIF